MSNRLEETGRNRKFEVRLPIDEEQHIRLGPQANLGLVAVCITIDPPVPHDDTRYTDALSVRIADAVAATDLRHGPFSVELTGMVGNSQYGETHGRVFCDSVDPELLPHVMNALLATDNQSNDITWRTFRA